MCSHPKPHKKKDYGFAEEILCPLCGESLEVKVDRTVDYVKARWFKRFLNRIRSWIREGKLTSPIRMPDGRVVVLVNTYLVRNLAREIRVDEDTLWKYARLLQDKNINGIVKPTTIPIAYNREHLAVQIIPAQRECEVWPYPVASLTIDRGEWNRVVGREFTVKVWLDYYFDEPTQVFIGVGDETEEWLGKRALTLTGKSTSNPYIVKVKPPPKLGDCKVVVFYLEGESWVQADSTWLNSEKVSAKPSRYLIDYIPPTPDEMLECYDKTGLFVKKDYIAEMRAKRRSEGKRPVKTFLWE